MKVEYFTGQFGSSAIFCFFCLLKVMQGNSSGPIPSSYSEMWEAQLNKAYLDFCKSSSMPALAGSEFSSMCRVLADQV